MPIETTRPISPQQLPTRAASSIQVQDPRVGAAAVAATILAMDPMIVAALSEEAANRQRGGGDGEPGRSIASAGVELTAPAKTMEEAEQMLAGIVERLPSLLFAPLGLQDPVTSEEGAEVRATEGAASLLPPGTGGGQPDRSEGRVDATGFDARLAAIAANFGGGFASSNFVNLLLALQQVLLEFAANERTDSATMSTIRLRTSEFAGRTQVQAAVESFGTNVASGMVGLGIGAASMKKMYDSTSMQTGSMQRNLREANTTSVTTDTMRVSAKTHATPSSALRPDRNLDNTPVRAATGNGRAAAQVEGDLNANVSAMNFTGKKTGLDAVPAGAQEAHAIEMSKSQIPQTQATLFNMAVFPAVTGAIQSGGAIQSQTTTVESDIAKQSADISGSTARTHQEQLANHRALIEAIAQLSATLLAQQHGTNQHILERA